MEVRSFHCVGRGCSTPIKALIPRLIIIIYIFHFVTLACVLWEEIPLQLYYLYYLLSTTGLSVCPPLIS